MENKEKDVKQHLTLYEFIQMIIDRFNELKK